VIAGLVLAAGASRRMGRPKMLLPIAGKTLLARAVAPLLEADLERVVVVLGGDADEIRRRGGLPDDPRVTILVNEAWAEGLSSSLRRGLEACEGAEAVVVVLGDQPDLDVETVRRVVEAWSPGRRLVAATSSGRVGHPVLIARPLWDEIRALSGDVGAREVLRRHWSEATLVEAVLPCDLDTQQDYESFLEGRAPRDRRGWAAEHEE